jgi:acyl-CoA synthetase (AMP-forming)/AMP-acid ligase II
MAHALRGLGVRMGERVATLAWNGYRHMELYYAVSGSGALLHTINPGLHPEQIAYIANHAEDQYLFFDLTFLPLIEAIAAHCAGDPRLGHDRNVAARHRRRAAGQAHGAAERGAAQDPAEAGPRDLRRRHEDRQRRRG